LEQKTLDKAVEIVGIPITPNENCKLTVEKITQKIKKLSVYQLNTEMKTIACCQTKRKTNY